MTTVSDEYREEYGAAPRTGRMFAFVARSARPICQLDQEAMPR